MSVALTILLIAFCVQGLAREGTPPESPTAPRKLISYAIQADPGLAWREIILMSALFVWALYELISNLVD
jgi:hypothetical protein